MANILPRDRQLAVLAALVEGNSIRSVERMTGVHRDTVMRLAVTTGETCAKLHDRIMRNLTCRDIQVDEIWSFVACKQRHLPEGEVSERGDAYTFVAIDRPSKLVVSYLVGKRNAYNTQDFIIDLERRLARGVKPQLSSDGFDPYPWAIEGAFGIDCDYAQVIKNYGSEDAGRGRYSPPKVIGIDTLKIIGEPDEARICTSHVERQNLTMRMAMRRFTRLTNGFSKKLANLKAAVALHFAYYNLVRVHRTLRVTPAMEAGVTDRVWTLADLLDSGIPQQEAA